MELYQLSERVFYSEYEEERDRPALGYLKGNRFSIAVDAGHSDDHLNEFYALLKKNDLPLPAFTIIAHWHWDHSFAMHAVNGFSVANRKTNGHLKTFIRERSKENDEAFLNLDPSIAKEYENGKPIIVKEADIVFDGKMEIDAGDLKAILFEAVSPHTDDATFIHVPEEKLLFFGDAISGVFPTWIADRKKTEELCGVIEGLDVEYCIGGHWPIYRKEDLLKELRERE